MKAIYLLILFSLILITKADTNNRLDCYLENNFTVDKKTCEERGCIWDPNPEPNGVPNCYLDIKSVGYKALDSVKKSAIGIEVELQLKETAKKTTKSFAQIENIKLEVSYLTNRILRFKIFDPKNKRYEVPFQKNYPLLQTSPQEKDENNRKYSVDLSYEESKDNFQFSISRKDTKTKVFDTSIGGLMFSDQFLQIATYLPSKNIYGFGENLHQSLRHDLNYRTWPLFTKDAPPGENDKNLYGVHPFYTCLENDGKSHGILLLNSNAMEYTLLPHPALSLKTLGGILDFFVFIGDNPEHVIQLYTSLIGRPVMPPFWGLGFQLSRYGFKGTDNLKQVIDRNLKAKAPLDVMYIDYDYMDQYRDWTLDPKKFAKLPELISDTKNNSKLRWTLIVDPGIEANDTNNPVFPDGYKQDVFVKWPKSVAMADRHNPANVPIDRDVTYGKLWPKGPAVYPDFFKNATQNWWTKWMNHLHKDLNVKFDAIWIDMNEPVNFDSVCPNTKYDFPEVRTKSVWYNNNNSMLSENTLCMTTIQGDNNEYMHYDVHSLYGLSETIATQKSLHEVTGKRGFVVSRSTSVSSGRYGSHWLGDNSSKWPHIRHSIIGMLEFNLFGISFVGPDICGFIGDTTPELCRRWLQLGAFYPFSRSHNAGHLDQDPGFWVTYGHPEVTEASNAAFKWRYNLLHYLYTLFYRAHTLGETVARPLFHEFPHDNNTHGIDQQFMWGRSLLISPFLFENQTEVDAYLPDDTWYEIGHFMKVSQIGHLKIADSPTGPPPMHLRGASIIPILEGEHVNTESIRQSPINLLVLPGKSKTATGDLFWDDGESINTIETGKYNYYTFELLANCTLEIDVIKSGYDAGGSHQTIDRITIADTADGDIEALLDEKMIVGNVAKEGLTLINVKLNLQSKIGGEKWTINWKSIKTNSCNIK